MTKVNRPILHGTIAQVLGGLVVAGVLAVIAQRSHVIRGMVDAWNPVSTWLSSASGIAIILSTIGACAFVIRAAARAIARRQHRGLDPKGVEAFLEYYDNKERLSNTERSILDAISDSPRRGIVISAALSSLPSASPDQTHAAIESLIIRGFLGTSNSLGGPKRVWLTNKGKLALDKLT